MWWIVQRCRAMLSRCSIKHSAQHSSMLNQVIVPYGEGGLLRSEHQTSSLDANIQNEFDFVVFLGSAKMSQTE
ncbi:MAG: hypothetical protein H6905_07175 [Hyphomicrobiales bacterium]|nr:hypothetical protein [Hyphomicrobiales bacterium]